MIFCKKSPYTFALLLGYAKVSLVCQVTYSQ